MSVALNTNALTSVANVKYVWGRAQADLAHDDRIATLINMLSGRIEDWCGRKFKSTAYDTPDFDAVYDGEEVEAGEDLQLRQYPIITLTSLTVDDVLVDASAYLVYKAEGRIHYPNGWGSGTGTFGAKQNVVIKYTAGYATIPPGIENCCVMWVIMLLEGQVKDSKVLFDPKKLEMPEVVQAALAPYKRYDF
jgi:hypothetical protein